jgi:hypothetical protein
MIPLAQASPRGAVLPRLRLCAEIKPGGKCKIDLACREDDQAKPRVQSRDDYPT